MGKAHVFLLPCGCLGENESTCVFLCLCLSVRVCDREKREKT